MWRTQEKPMANSSTKFLSYREREIVTHTHTHTLSSRVIFSHLLTRKPCEQTLASRTWVPIQSFARPQFSNLWNLCSTPQPANISSRRGWSTHVPNACSGLIVRRAVLKCVPFVCVCVCVCCVLCVCVCIVCVCVCVRLSVYVCWCGVVCVCVCALSTSGWNELASDFDKLVFPSIFVI